MNNDTPATNTSSTNMGTVVLMLGLYLIVLAFFILLNAISQFAEHKVQEVSDSVAEGFGFTESGKTQMRDNVESVETPAFKLVSDNVRQIMESYISVKDFDFTENDGHMEIRIATNVFFKKGEIKIRPQQAEFFADVAKVLVHPRAGFTIVADVSFSGNKADVGHSSLPVLELAGRRATLFARALVNQGVNPMQVSAAAYTGNKSEIILRFIALGNSPMDDVQKAKQISWILL